MLKIMLIDGARPNFMKIAPIARAFDRGSTHNEYCNIYVGYTDLFIKIVHIG